MITKSIVKTKVYNGGLYFFKAHKSDHNFEERHNLPQWKERCLEICPINHSSRPQLMPSGARTRPHR